MPTHPSCTLTIAGTPLEVQVLHAEIADPGPTLVFLHEGLGSVALWRDWPRQLCQRLGLAGLVYSRQGYGQSDARPDVRGEPRVVNGLAHGRLHQRAHLLQVAPGRAE